jgi:phosphate:Na+ symporter
MDPVSGMIHRVSSDEGRFVANAHTIFKIFQVIILLPFSTLIVKMTYLIVPGKDQKVGYQEAFQLQYFGDKVLFNPSTAVVDGMKELERMASLAYDNLNRSMNALITLDDDDINQVYEVEKNIDFLNNSITQYFVKINQSTLPIEDLKELGSLFHVANDIERIGDHAENIADMAMRRKALGVGFSADAQAELAQMMASVDAMIEKAIKCILTSGDKTKLMMEISELEGKIDSMEKQFQQHHIDRLTKQQCTAEAGMIFSDVISGLERVSDHALNIVRYLQRRDLAEITE